MSNLIFVSDIRIINPDAIAYIEIFPDVKNTDLERARIYFIGNNSGTYDLALNTKETQVLMTVLEQRR